MSLINKTIKYLNSIKKIDALTNTQKEKLSAVCDKYSFRANDYYLNLINWDDPNDPIKKIILPILGELEDWGKLDASNESAVTVAKGTQHKYPHTALLLCNETCGGFCRYCFRKRLFMPDNSEASLDVSEGLNYIKNHPEITNVLLTGGDPLLLSTKRLEEIISSIKKIKHVKILRIGSKIPAFNPFRVIDDESLKGLLKSFNQKSRRMYIMTHFDSHKELTAAAKHCINDLINNGVILCNQCPLLKGINDSPEQLAELFNQLSFCGCPPYYVFQGRTTQGNKPFSLPITKGYEIFEEAKKLCSGTALRAKFVMSHESGKIEIIGVDNNQIYLKYHRAKNPENLNKIFIAKRDDNAYWLDDLKITN